MLFQFKGKKVSLTASLHILGFLALVMSLNHFSMYQMFKFTIPINETCSFLEKIEVICGRSWSFV